MRGSESVKSAGWAARWDEPGEGGKRRQRRKGGFATKRKADRFLRDQLARLDDGTYATPSNDHRRRLPGPVAGRAGEPTTASQPRHLPSGGPLLHRAPDRALCGSRGSLRGN